MTDLEEIYKAMDSVVLECDNFHHEKKDRHGYDETCKPLYRFILAKDLLEQMMKEKK